MPSILYVYPAPTGLTTVIVPCGTAHVGCTTVSNGTAGVSGAAFILMLSGAETQPEVFLAMMVYVPAASWVNVADV